MRSLPSHGEETIKLDGVELSAAGRPLTIGRGSAGFELSWERNPGWQVTVKVDQMNRRGMVLRPVGERHLRLGPLAPALRAEPTIPLPSRPGIYRSTMIIRDGSVSALTGFGNYYRVVRARPDDRLATEKAAYLPGETLLARLENPGLAYVLFGEGFAVEALQAGAWTPVPDGFESVSTPLRFVGPGETGSLCLTVPIPATTTPGRYRLSQKTVLSWPSSTGKTRPVLFAEFDVVAP